MAYTPRVELTFALSWKQGKRSSRRCLGVIDYDNGACKRIIRPQTTPQGIAFPPVRCGAMLSHTACTVVSVLMSWNGGIHYANGGHHEHPRPTYQLHVSRSSTTQRRKNIAMQMSTRSVFVAGGSYVQDINAGWSGRTFPVGP
jgi:hypothetical protein